jgi:hypothetical protein
LGAFVDHVRQQLHEAPIGFQSVVARLDELLGNRSLAELQCAQMLRRITRPVGEDRLREATLLSISADLDAETRRA